MSIHSKNYFRNVYQHMKNEFVNTFCRLVAPGQEQKFKFIVDMEEKSDLDALVSHLKDAYDLCSTRDGRRSVLMLIPKSYKKLEVCKIFECSMYEVNKARNISKLYGTCTVEPKKEQVYSRLSIQKAEHFINFLFSSGILQELAYGTAKLKFDSGEQITIANTVLNGVREHAVKQYLIHCNELDYRPLGRTSLLNILNKMNTRTRLKLAGIDTFVVEGIEAFEALKSCVKLLESSDRKNLLKSINEAESYIKTRYKFHCEDDDACVSHCIQHALSHPKDKDLFSKCGKNHNRICVECEAMVNCISSLKNKLNQLEPSHEKDIAEYEAHYAETKIMEWQRHLMRGVQQSKARSNAFAELGESKALWLRDYAQKYNPTKTLEGMNEYFGKRGISVSVEVFITKLSGKYQKKVYLVGLDRCDQDSIETLCIADIVLSQFHRDNPAVKEIEIKSDNAGNYHANGVPETMYILGQKIGIFIPAYNYNEAQLGKDQCDREAAIFKACAERFLLQKETNKISTAKELLDAIFSDGGPKNTKMCILKIDKTLAEWKGTRKVSNISYYHSIEFQETGALYKEYYNIGKGKFHEYSGVDFVNSASFVVDWTSSVRQAEYMNYESRKKNKFVCPEMMCILEFENEDEMISHIASGIHQHPQVKNTMDKVILYYAQQKQLQNLPTESSANSIQTDVIENMSKSRLFHQFYTLGWARKVRRVDRLLPKQKDYIEKLFLTGATTKNKLSAEQITQRMKDEMLNGQYVFRPDEYLRTTQIRSLITRFKKQYYNHENKLLIMSEDDGIQANIDEICDSVLYSDSEWEDFEGFDTCDI